MQSTRVNRQSNSSQGKADPAGREASSPWKMPARGWLQSAKRTWSESSKDNVGLIAAGVAFYGFLALVPLLAASVLLYGIVADPKTVVEHAKSLTAILPAEAAKLIGDQLLNVVQTSGGKKGIGLISALAIALWGARNSAGAMISALNVAYEEEEKRGFLKVTLLSLLMTIAAAVIAVVAASAAVAVGSLQTLIPGMGPAAKAVSTILIYVLVTAVMAGAVAALYRYAPSRDRPRWEWISPGSLLATVGWLVLTIGFGFYAANFGNYGATYGSISAVIVLLTWFYFSAYLLILGAELNSELEHQTAKDTTEGSDRPLGARGAWAADHVAAGEAASRPDKPQEIPVNEPASSAPSGPSPAQTYVAARTVSNAGSLVGSRRIGMVSTLVATIGLGLLRRRGREVMGVALLAGAGAISLARRD
jgi:membrane protein